MGLSNTQYREIMYKYDQTRLKNQRTLDERYSELFIKIPELETVHNQIITMSAEQARLSILEPEKAENLQSRYDIEKAKLRQKKTDLLTQNGYPADYLSPIYKCSKCKDTGYIDNEPCSCFKQLKIQLLYENSNLIHILNDENFNTFNFDYYDDSSINKNIGITPRQNIKNIHNKALKFVREFDNEYKNMILYGPTGVGKTFLTHCIAKSLLDTSHTVVYLTSLQLFDILEKNKFNKDDTFSSNEHISYILNCELLIIDDLGTELVNSFTASQLYYFIEERHLNQKSTIFSTNLSFKELRDRYSERIFSRFTGYYTFHMLVGDDIRIKIAIS
ncbi:MAG: ATP-binding protein [Lachnospiraceae bacterium]|nr:ATP-binding protein [Lachnospiraceae bacterium]